MHYAINYLQNPDVYHLGNRVIVIGAGNAGTVAALRCQEEGANVFLADMQTYDEYDEYACDMACYNSKLFLDKGTPEIDTTEVFNEYMRLSRGHAHQKIVRDYAMRSGEMLDWMVGHIPAEYVEKYAKTSNYKGNDNFNGECCGQRSWPAMTQWRDEESNINMWPFVIRSVHAAFEEAGGTIKWGYQGVVLVQDGEYTELTLEGDNEIGPFCSMPSLNLSGDELLTVGEPDSSGDYYFAAFDLDGNELARSSQPVGSFDAVMMKRPNGYLLDTGYMWELYTPDGTFFGKSPFPWVSARPCASCAATSAPLMFSCRWKKTLSWQWATTAKATEPDEPVVFRITTDF